VRGDEWAGTHFLNGPPSSVANKLRNKLKTVIFGRGAFAKNVQTGPPWAHLGRPCGEPGSSGAWSGAGIRLTLEAMVREFGAVGEASLTLRASIVVPGSGVSAHAATSTKRQRVSCPATSCDGDGLPRLGPLRMRRAISSAAPTSQIGACHRGLACSSARHHQPNERTRPFPYERGGRRLDVV
jgi:hypothetical protein